MTRYKGRTSQKAIERDFPHVVEIAVPPRGLGAQLDAMHHFHRARGIQACIGLGRRDRAPRLLTLVFHQSGSGKCICNGVRRHGNKSVEQECLIKDPRGGKDVCSPLVMNGATWTTTLQLHIPDEIGHCRQERTCIHRDLGCIRQVVDGARRCQNNRRRTVLLPLRKRSARAECGRRATSPASARS